MWQSGIDKLSICLRFLTYYILENGVNRNESCSYDIHATLQGVFDKYTCQWHTETSYTNLSWLNRILLQINRLVITWY